MKASLNEPPGIGSSEREEALLDKMMNGQL